jgi:hypothetical protein
MRMLSSAMTYAEARARKQPRALIDSITMGRRSRLRVEIIRARDASLFPSVMASFDESDGKTINIPSFHFECGMSLKGVCRVASNNYA